MAKFRKNKLKNQKISLIRIIPNLITVSALCIGLSAIRFSLDAKWEQAVGCILVAAILDAIDGRIARYLNATSTFGAELDSLCDFVNFGIAPVILTYLWILNEYRIKVLSWGV
ncbi:MAG: CDP-alcohol phosphatidyltransferase family protein, partial [Rickettsiaceae bacterium]|nr:CDP-alcohol phosphatidyltransferase family protein [Rickettsiaceae bacterium]